MTAPLPIVAAAVLIIAYFATSIVCRSASSVGLVDVPNARSSHSNPTPRGGGIAIVLAFLFGILLLFFLNLIDAKIVRVLISAGGAVALIGLIDDRRPLPVYVRFGVHTAAAVFAISVIGGLPERELADWGLHGKFIGLLLSVLTVLWGVNLFNFMDGIDGIAGSEAVFIALAGAFLNWLVGGNPGVTAAMICLAAACVGFLFFNWPPANIFMGDVGSGFLGLTLVLLAIYASQTSRIPVEVWPILGGVFLVDATVTLIRRILRGDRWREPHRLHGYQHLARLMRGHRPVTLIVIAINVFWLLPWAAYAVTEGANRSLCLAAALLPIVAAAMLLGSGTQRE